MAFITKSEVKAIREELKKQFPNLRFSVTGANSHSVNVSLIKGDVDFSDVTDKGHFQVNHHHLFNYGEHQGLFEHILRVIKVAPGIAEGGQTWFDDSDSMTDYFHTAFYIWMSVGRWNKPYEYTGKE